MVVIGTPVSLTGSFVLGFLLLLMPWGDPTLGNALRESGSSGSGLGFLLSAESAATLLDVLAGATGMISVALITGYLPTVYSEVKAREFRVRRLSGWAGTPSWGPEILFRLALTPGRWTCCPHSSRIGTPGAAGSPTRMPNTRCWRVSASVDQGIIS